MSSEVIFQKIFLEDCVQLALLAVYSYLLNVCCRIPAQSWYWMGRSRHRRSRTEVIVSLLEEALSGANKTRLMYHCNLNFMRFNSYLKELLDAGLIECIDTNPEGIVLYKTTEKGRELLRVLRKASEFLSI
jgi:predicted transcriptional regulator